MLLAHFDEGLLSAYRLVPTFPNFEPTRMTLSGHGQCDGEKPEGTVSHTEPAAGLLPASDLEVYRRLNNISVTLVEPLITNIPKPSLLKLQYCANAMKLQREVLRVT